MPKQEKTTHLVGRKLAPLSDTNSRFWQQFQQALTSPKRSRQMLTPKQGKQQLWSSFEQVLTSPTSKATEPQKETKRKQSQRMMPEAQTKTGKNVIMVHPQEERNKQEQVPKTRRTYAYYSGGLGMRSAPLRSTLERLG